MLRTQEISQFLNSTRQILSLRHVKTEFERQDSLMKFKNPDNFLIKTSRITIQALLDSSRFSNELGVKI
jgi:hypothetical protein